MKNLIEKIAEYKNATQVIINKTKELEKFIKENVPFEFWEDCSLKKFGIAQSESWHFAVYNNPIPPSPDKFSTYFYWGGDFNSRYQYCTGAEIIDWSREIPKIINQVQEAIEAMTERANDNIIMKTKTIQ